MKLSLRKGALFACVAALVACGRGRGASDAIRPDVTTAPGDGQQGGSRLQPLMFSNSDGSTTSFGWMDTKLNQRCSFDLLYGSTGACIPDDVYTVSYESFTDGYKLSNPTFYVEPTCQDATKKGIFVSQQRCLDYGLMRVTPDADPIDFPSCSRDAGPTYYVLTKFDPTKQKAYQYGVPDGGGTCCSCNEITSAPTGSAMYLIAPASEENLAAVQLVTGTLNRPIAP